MGLWLKKDGEFVPVSGGGGGDAGPHNHDYLPLAGGTLTGGLQVDGTIRAAGGNHVLSGGQNVLQLRNSTPTSKPYMSVYFNDVRAGYFGNPSASSGGVTEVHAEGNTLRLRSAVKVQVTTDLQVDGQIKAQANGTPSNPGILFGTDGSGVYGADGFVGFTQGGTWQLSVTSNQVRIKPDLQVDGDGQVDGTLKLPNCRDQSDAISVAPNVYLTQSGNLRFTTFEVAPKAFSIADGIDTRDVLDRAEVATMPTPDDEGVATADIETLTVNEVVTALLAKVKEQSEQIAILSADIQELKGN
jgi:hypothetical protein